ncbi:uncharacterized protein Nmag_2483 [Natrialba magadii ATCC 43099]|uniref:DUF7344 domain-containing protein n=1 Tax=Natrialba magadii (strain ATCC 43099 / DSM 3394 / CCM 3739 / CIP 104546 / IAM 13178 / JCM 8861 / NBRC 102185 / NCIMB 2190 / MS3) TaxID=547559 RepID=D3SY72_NATMM|nr:hypothetical protein [Natrialba magadii]ADD06043.1 uncharacterized protein Nmag_2483 [Natrialba magadii ATCC 43099]ELY30960.1 hypothetical protein C500_07978 [Natrialba magadii ATCC 43099]
MAQKQRNDSIERKTASQSHARSKAAATETTESDGSTGAVADTNSGSDADSEETAGTLAAEEEDEEKAENEEEEEEEEPAPLSKGDVFEVLRNQRRRYVLHFLKQDGRPVELGDLAQQLAAWEYDTTLDGVTPAQRKRVYTTLQQTHLPKMDEVGILHFDSDQGVIRPTDRTRDISVYLEIVPGREFAWRELYLSLGAISSALVAALWLEIYPLTMMSNLAWMGLLSVVVTLTAVVHIYHERHMRLGHGEQPPELSYGPGD